MMFLHVWLYTHTHAHLSLSLSLSLMWGLRVTNDVSTGVAVYTHTHTRTSLSVSLSLSQVGAPIAYRLEVTMILPPGRKINIRVRMGLRFPLNALKRVALILAALQGFGFRTYGLGS